MRKGSFLSLAPVSLQSNLVCLVLEGSDLKLQLLSTTSTLERMKLNKSVLRQLQDAQVNGCSIM